MQNIESRLHSVGFTLAPGKLGLVRAQLDGIIRAPNLVPQMGKSHESVWKHTLSMLQENQRVFKAYPSLTRELDLARTVGGIFMHDVPEGFTVLQDLNYADSSHNGHDVRREKELDEHAAMHHFVRRNVLGKESKRMSHHFIDEWAIMESPLALYVRLHDMIDGNKAVINKAINLRNGVIQKTDSDDIVRIWPAYEAGIHIANIASTKTFPILEKLVHRVNYKEASIEIIHWFQQAMMHSYHDAGWGYLPVIKEMQRFLDIELKGI